MTRREKVLAVIRREYNEYIPFAFSFTPIQQEKFYNEFYEWDYQNMLNLPYQYVHYYYKGKTPDWKSYFPPNVVKQDHLFDEFGVGRKKSDYFNLDYLISPLKEAKVEELDSFPFPNPDKYSWTETIDHCKEIIANDSVSVGFLALTFFEIAWTLRGYDQWLEDINKTTPFFYKLLEIITDIRIQQTKRLVQVGIDVLHIGDDIADSNGLVIDINLWRNEFKPRYKQIINIAKEIKHDILIEYHGEGNITEIIPDLIEIGVDMLNPIEPESVNPFELKERFGNDISFRGGLSVHTTLPNGTKEEIKEETINLMKQMSKNGGYICSPTQSIHTGVPWDNFVVFLRTIKNYNENLKK